MKRRWLTVHAVIAAAWIALAGWYGLRIALLGGEQTLAEKDAARARVEQRERREEHQRLRDQLGWEASPAALHEAAGVLALPLVDEDGRRIGANPGGRPGAVPEARR